MRKLHISCFSTKLKYFKIEKALLNSSVAQFKSKTFFRAFFNKQINLQSFFLVFYLKFSTVFEYKFSLLHSYTVEMSGKKSNLISTIIYIYIYIYMQIYIYIYIFKYIYIYIYLYIYICNIYIYIYIYI